ncbi:UDP-N-acetylmuramate dehydrogenase [Rhodococcus sp. X156]|uniref:UDP-N-acetylmuramate dehydrogenase n=1 Tax=Rhodococcus sp. X156 TaxID=2499145 RepID=UPI001F494DF5|nr:UDP-N-acetylmuramate dehydrogenase [Rhodococcus sp. X156]
MLDPKLLRQVEAAGAQAQHDVPFATMTTLRCGGPAHTVLHCTTTDAVVAAVRALDDAGEPLLVLGGGSNLVVADAGFAGTVVRVATDEVRSCGTAAADPAGSGSETVTVHVAAGTPWDAVVAKTVADGLGGLECLSGIPGRAGATPVQNVGAYGVEISSVLQRVQLLQRTDGQVRWVEPAELALGYRTSALKHTDHAVVLAVELALRADGASAALTYRELTAALDTEPGARLPAAQVRDAVLGLRRGKGMVSDAGDHDSWSAGSFFTNPVLDEQQLAQVLARTGPDVPRYPGAAGTKLSAGWLIEHAGFHRGYPDADAPARLSTKHTLALTNRGHASTADLLALARVVRDGVRHAFGVELEPEPVLVGCRL